MELDWVTFSLEIVNFLVLLWILKRFLYKPVLNVIAQRQASINEKLEQATAKQTEAEQLKSQYTNRLTEWENEKKLARHKLDEEIDTLRTQRLQELNQQVENERQKAQIIEQRKLEQQQTQLEISALYQGARFTSKLLTQLADPVLEQKLIELFLSQLQDMSEQQQQTIRANIDPASNEVQVCSAYPLPQSVQQFLETALNKLVGKTITLKCCRDPDLIAGLRVSIGAFMLQANIQDELQSFARYANNSHIDQ